MVYTAIIDHIRRAAGYVWWDKNGPLYEVDGDGRAKYLGSFDEHGLACYPPATDTIVKKLLAHSRIWQVRVGAYYCLPRNEPTSERDRTRFFEIVRRRAPSRCKSINRISSLSFGMSARCRLLPGRRRTGLRPNWATTVFRHCDFRA